MPLTILPRGSVERCPKCEHHAANASTTYQASCQAYEGRDIVTQPERMYRKCDRCGFSWYERPADYKEPAPVNVIRIAGARDYEAEAHQEIEEALHW